MVNLERTFQNPLFGAGVPIGSAALAEICQNLIPVLTVASLIIGIGVGLTSLFVNIKKTRNEKN